MIELNDLNPTKKPKQTASDYYKNKRIIWDLRNIISKYNFEQKQQSTPWAVSTIWDNGGECAMQTINTTMAPNPWTYVNNSTPNPPKLNQKLLGFV